MKNTHTKSKSARRPFTGVIPNKQYNWFSHLVEISKKIGKKEMYYPPYAKLPKPTYKNLR